MEAFGYTRGGFTPVATTAHCVSSLDVAARFYQDALNLEIVLDEVLGRPETNHFLNRPADARSRTIFLSGDSIFGKLSLNEPLNYDVPERSQPHARRPLATLRRPSKLMGWARRLGGPGSRLHTPLTH